jgi:hypothetical protein
MLRENSYLTLSLQTALNSGRLPDKPLSCLQAVLSDPGKSGDCLLLAFTYT